MAIAGIADRLLEGVEDMRAQAGAWRVWWEPHPDWRAMGLEPVELDPARPTWSVRQAKTLTDQARQLASDPLTPVHLLDIPGHALPGIAFHRVVDRFAHNGARRADRGMVQVDRHLKVGK